MADLGKIFKGVGVALSGSSQVLRQAEQDKQRRDQLEQQRLNAEEARAGAQAQRKMAVSKGLLSFYDNASRLTDPQQLDNLIQSYRPMLDAASQEYGTAYTNDTIKGMKDYLKTGSENLQDALIEVNAGIKSGKPPQEIWASVVPRLNGMPPAMQKNLADVFSFGLSEYQNRQAAMQQAQTNQSVSRLSGGEIQSTQELEIAKQLSGIREKNAKALKSTQTEQKSLSTNEKKRRTEVLKEVDANAERLTNVDIALGAVDKVADKLIGLGPISGGKFVGNLRRIMGDSDFETVKAILGQEGLTKIAAFAKDAGARAIDSEGERAYLQATLASESMNPEAIKTLLYITKAQALRKANTLIERENLLEQGAPLSDFKSPNADKKAYYKEGTPEVILARPGEEPEGFVALESRYSNQAGTTKQSVGQSAAERLMQRRK